MENILCEPRLIEIVEFCDVVCVCLGVGWIVFSRIPLIAEETFAFFL